MPTESDSILGMLLSAIGAGLMAEMNFTYLAAACLFSAAVFAVTLVLSYLDGSE